MRHQKHRFQLGRKKEHRTALMANLGAALLQHGRIRTTLAKAKALRPFIEKIITLAKHAENAPKEKALHLRRLAMSRIRDREAVALLFNERVSSFSDRTGGYTRIYKLGSRIGDGAEMAVIQLIPAEDEGYARRRKGSRAASADSSQKPEPEEAAAVAAAEAGSAMTATETAVTDTETVSPEVAEAAADPESQDSPDSPRKE